jgi:hypothetical protein
MANFPSLKEPLTLEQLKTFRENFEIAFAEELNGPDWHGYYTTYSIPDFSLSWTNETEHNIVKNEFTDYSYTLVGEKEPKKIDQKLLEIEQDLAKNPGQIFRTTPTEEVLERGEGLAEEHKIQSAESKASAEEKTQKFIKQLKGRKVIVTAKDSLQEINLTSEEKTKIFNLAQAVKADAGTTQKLIEQKIQESVDKSSAEIKENITKPIVIRAAIDLVEKTKPFSVYKNPSEIPNTISVLSPASPLVSISDPNNPDLVKLIPDKETRTTLSQNAQSLALAIEAENNINHSLTTSLFAGSENISEIFYPQQIAQFQIAENQEERKDEGVEISIDDVYGQGERVRNIWQKLSNEVTTVDNVVTSTTSIVPTYTPSLNTAVATQTTSFVTAAIPATVGGIVGWRTGVVVNYFLTNNIPLLTGAISPTLSLPSMVATSSPAFAYRMIVGGVEVPISASNMTIFTSAEVAATKAAGMATGQVGRQSINIALGNAVARGASSLAAKFGLTALSVKIGATVGTGIIPVIGTIVGAVLGTLFGKIIEKVGPWIKKHQEDLMMLGGLLMGGGAIFRSIPIFAFGGLIFIPTALKTGFSLAHVAARTTFIFGRIGASMAITIATPVIVTLIVFPILVAIILFIINSGAYLVPPSGSLIGLENPYIKIEKKAILAGPFNNSDIPSKTKIEYTVTISAKKGLLTNITLKDECKVIKNGTPPSCPSPSQETPEPPDSISPSSPFSFKYTLDIASHDYDDSAVVNTFTVTADAQEEKGATSITSASIIIGKPPADCPTNSWPLANNEGIDNVTQGSLTPPGWTHHGVENAIDIGVNGATAIATHNGTVTVGESACGGRFVQIASSCGAPFSSYYGHLGSVSVSTGQKVTIGQVLGISDNTGSCSTGAHMHFQFFDSGSIPTTQKPYLKRDIPIGCTNLAGNPCN